MGALAGLGAGGAVGGVVGALVGMGIPEYEAKRFEGAVKNGGTLLSVHCETSDEVTAAKNALRDTGAHDIAASGEESSSEPAGARRDTETADIESERDGAALSTTVPVLTDAYPTGNYNRLSTNGVLDADATDRSITQESPLADEELAVASSSDKARHYPPS
jgi:hypothetical protein